MGNERSHKEKLPFPLRETSVPIKGNWSFYKQKRSFPSAETALTGEITGLKRATPFSKKGVTICPKGCSHVLKRV